MSKIFLYGIGGARDQYRVLRYEDMGHEKVSISDMTSTARYMRFKNPSIERVFAVDDRYGLAGDYRKSIKRNTIESCAIFKDLLERDGIEIRI